MNVVLGARIQRSTGNRPVISNTDQDHSAVRVRERNRGVLQLLHRGTPLELHVLPLAGKRRPGRAAALEAVGGIARSGTSQRRNRRGPRSSLGAGRPASANPMNAASSRGGSASGRWQVASTSHATLRTQRGRRCSALPARSTIARCVEVGLGRSSAVQIAPSLCALAKVPGPLAQLSPHHAPGRPQGANLQELSEDDDDGETRTRTGDTTIFSRVLYQLSYLAVAERC